jgi:hypothetical protein
MEKVSRGNADPKASSSVFVHTGQIEIEAKKVIFEFSKDGGYLAMLKDDSDLVVFQIKSENLEEDRLLKQIEEE